MDKRYDFDACGGCWIRSGKGWSNEFTAATIAKATKKRKLSISASSAWAESQNSHRANFYQEALKAARDKFTREISFQSEDNDISLAKALLYAAAEDEAYMAFQREIDMQSLHKEKREALLPSDVQEWDCLETMPLCGKNINQWLAELDAIAKEVEAELVPREIGCHLVEVLEAVNVVLFESKGFKRSPVLLDSKCAYLHSVLSSGCCCAILLSAVYIEVCQRLNLTIVGARVEEDFFNMALNWEP